MNKFLESALHYCDLGFSVIPICSPINDGEYKTPGSAPKNNPNGTECLGPCSLGSPIPLTLLINISAENQKLSLWLIKVKYRT